MFHRDGNDARTDLMETAKAANAKSQIPMATSRLLKISIPSTIGHAMPVTGLFGFTGVL